jgi:hypothetical protein
VLDRQIDRNVLPRHYCFLLHSVRPTDLDSEGGGGAVICFGKLFQSAAFILPLKNALI